MFKPNEFYEPLNNYLKEQNKKYKKRSQYSARQLKEELSILTLDELSELIYLAEAEKAEQSQSIFSNFAAFMSLILAVTAILFTIYADRLTSSIFELSLFSYVVFFVLSLLLAYSQEKSRITRYKAITYYLEKLKQIKNEKSNV